VRRASTSSVRYWSLRKLVAYLRKVPQVDDDLLANPPAARGDRQADQSQLGSIRLAIFHEPRGTQAQPSHRSQSR
jgi:hypothetical protein